MSYLSVKEIRHNNISNRKIPLDNEGRKKYMSDYGLKIRCDRRKNKYHNLCLMVIDLLSKTPVEEMKASSQSYLLFCWIDRLNQILSDYFDIEKIIFTNDENLIKSLVEKMRLLQPEDFEKPNKPLYTSLTKLKNYLSYRKSPEIK